MNKKLLSAMFGGIMLLCSGALAGCTFGKDGLNGTNGSIWFSGVEDPTVAIGTIGDYYFETDTCNVWKYDETGWTIISNLKGDKGDQGEDAESTDFVVEKDYKLTTSYVLHSDQNYPLFKQGTFTETFCGTMTYDSCVIRVKKELISVEWTQSNGNDVAVVKFYFNIKATETFNPTYCYDSYEVYLNNEIVEDLNNETLNDCININVLNTVLLIFDLGEAIIQLITQGDYSVSNFCIIDRETHHSYYVAQTYGF